MPFDGSGYQTIAQRMRALLGGAGENWRRSTYYGDGRYCLVGAYIAVTHADELARVATIMGEQTPRMRDIIKTSAINGCVTAGLPEERGYQLLQHAIGLRCTAIETFNDQVAKSFADIEAALDRMHAAEIAEAAQPALIEA